MSEQDVCPTCHNEGIIERLATPDEVSQGKGAEFGLIHDPCPNDAWHNRPRVSFEAGEEVNEEQEG